ncbi:MAG: aminopeptidase P family protein [Oscillospiraceae bacterium]|nr:aminopeptidase P family protein [Oscillospiraceae bacterium]
MIYLNQTAQIIARDAMDEIKKFIKPGVTEREIRKEVECLLIKKGSTSFWYHGIGGLVHVGRRTLVSQGGRGYRVTDTAVRENDIITLDLAPTVDGAWGDFARTIFVQDGVVVDESEVKDERYRYALECEYALHKFVMETATPDMTFEELFLRVNGKLSEMEAYNLDYSGNWGHSVNILQEERVYIKPRYHEKLGDYVGFTFEPHLQCKDYSFGIKRENIYYFGHDGKVKEL